MKVSHIGIWTLQLEELRKFYEIYFGGKSNEKYINPNKGFESYMLYFEEGVAIEIMKRVDILSGEGLSRPEQVGLAHLAFSVGSKENVNSLTNRLRQAGYSVLGEPRTTGDGFYESVVGDPDGNQIEITV